jgi:hypothetical protein
MDSSSLAHAIGRRLPERMERKVIATIKRMLGKWAYAKDSGKIEAFVSLNVNLPAEVCIRAMKLLSWMGEPGPIMTIVHKGSCCRDMDRVRRVGAELLRDMDERGRIYILLCEKGLLPRDAYRMGIDFFSDAGWPGILFNIYTNPGGAAEPFREYLSQKIVDAMWVCAEAGDMGPIQHFLLVMKDGSAAVPCSVSGAIEPCLLRAIEVSRKKGDETALTRAGARIRAMARGGCTVPDSVLDSIGPGKTPGRSCETPEAPCVLPPDVVTCEDALRCLPNLPSKVSLALYDRVMEKRRRLKLANARIGWNRLSRQPAPPPATRKMLIKR